METSILIIGGGITGTAIARELSKYHVDVILVEKELDIAFGGPSKANTSIIHAGYDEKPGTLTAKLCYQGNMLWPKLTSELGIPFKRIGSFVVALKNEHISILKELLNRGRRNNIPKIRIIEGNELFQKEPNLNRNAIACLFAFNAGVLSPYEAAIALAENARENGVSIFLGTKVLKLNVETSEIKAVYTNNGVINAKYVINAAGLFADEISSMAGINEFNIIPRKGEYIIYDKDLSGMVKHILFPAPSLISKGITVTPTVDGNIVVGPNAHDIKDKNDTATTIAGLKEVLDGAYKLVPELCNRREAIITSFAGLRPQPTTEDFIIKTYEDPHGFINVAGTKSPGLTSAPAIAKTVVNLLRKDGAKLEEKNNFKLFRKPILHPFRTYHRRNKKIIELITENHQYGNIICRCEHVTEGEVIDAIHRGGATLDGVKNRTRAGMGRCQGGFCTPHLIKIIARQLQQPIYKVSKRGGNSILLKFPAKKLLSGDVE